MANICSIHYHLRHRRAKPGADSIKGWKLHDQHDQRGPNGLSDTQLIDGIGATEIAVSGSRRDQLRFIREFDLRECWQHDGARHMGQWLAAHLGISVSEGLRRTKAAHALERLPLLSDALEQGILSFEKVLQLARYLDADTEEREIAWARKARLDAIKRKADVANRPTLTDVQALEVSRYLTMWQCDEFGSLGIQGRLPAAEGALFKATIEQAAKHVPVAPDEEPDPEQQNIDALYQMTVGGSAGGTGPVGAGAAAAADGDDAPGNVAAGDADRRSGLDPVSERERSTVVVHADLDALLSAARGAEIEGGPVIAPEVASRMLCDCDIELNIHDGDGAVVGVGRASREPPRWLRRLLKKRDGGCTFPVCGLTTFLDAHHIIHWEHGGLTDLANLTLLCHHHHKLVHEFGWKVVLNEAQTTEWFRPDGSRFEPEKRVVRRSRRVAALSAPARQGPGSDHRPVPGPDRGVRSDGADRLSYPMSALASGFG